MCYSSNSEVVTHQKYVGNQVKIAFQSISCSRRSENRDPQGREANSRKDKTDTFTEFTKHIVVLWHPLSRLYGAVAVFVAFAKIGVFGNYESKRKLHDLRSGLGNKIG